MSSGSSKRPQPKPNQKPKQKHRPTASNGTKRAKKASEAQRFQQLESAVMDFKVTDTLSKFADLPISEPTKKGLKKAFFTTMTDIQKSSIPVSLQMKDVLGAARTGSGKTLAFLVPLLEILYRRKWGPSDGLGALVISPTRELALQIFEVLKSIGPYHSFSAGLVIGGKAVKDERDRLSKMNILIATPGRLLQHLDQTFGFECDNLQLLVLDEADRILDMGFKKTLSALLGHLPKSRQTLLFSATQTDSVQDLARLSLKEPVSIGIADSSVPENKDGDNAEASTSKSLETPTALSHHYLLCPLDQKLSLLWNFIRTHLTSKSVIFLSSCKQVRFIYECFRRMQPGVSLLHLHGKQKQLTRLGVYKQFASMKQAVLFATDIASRGLDFPGVEWVVQGDAPEDVQTYVHRVGRTARYDKEGRALLFLCPSEEEGMLHVLKEKGIVIEKIKVKESVGKKSLDQEVQRLAWEDPELKYLGQRAFVSYLRSVHLHKDKNVFKVNELPIERYAESLGLPGAPKIKFLNNTKQKKNAVKQVIQVDGETDPSSSEAEEEETERVRTKYDRMFERKNQNILSEHYAKMRGGDEEKDGEDEDDFITLKRADHTFNDADQDAATTDDLRAVKLDNLSKRKQKLGKAKKQILLNSGVGTETIEQRRLKFDEEGEGRKAHPVAPAEDWVKEKGGMEGVIAEGEKYALAGRVDMKEADVVDKEVAKEKRREKKLKRKRKDQDKSDGKTGASAVLGADSDVDDGYVSPEFDLPEMNSEEEKEYFRPLKKAKKTTRHEVDDDIMDEEELALQVLRKRR